ncbi:MAG: anti-sigma factor domain-containing protein [Actinobacteria bacterium]|nr:anti-sigma factor domain-containing protein [Actinomycetota bacterium]
MKAVVLEVHKNYCVVVTVDGQFLRQDIPAGSLEIGDEVIIGDAVTYPVKRNWIKRLAIASAAAIVVILSGFGLYKILPEYLPSMGAAKENKAVTDESFTGRAAGEEAEEEEQDSGIMLSESEECLETVEPDEGILTESATGEQEFSGESGEDSGVLKIIPAGAGQVDAEFYLKLAGEGQPVEVSCGDLLIACQQLESGGSYSLDLIIENLGAVYKYSGIAAFEVRTVQGEICGLDVFELNEFSAGEKFAQAIALTCPGETVRVEFKGQFE